MEAFNPMSALPPSGVVGSTDDGLDLQMGQSLVMDGFDTDMPFDDYTL
jgi:hypothetical protein